MSRYTFDGERYHDGKGNSFSAPTEILRELQRLSDLRDSFQVNAEYAQKDAEGWRASLCRFGMEFDELEAAMRRISATDLKLTEYDRIVIAGNALASIQARRRKELSK